MNINFSKEIANNIIFFFRHLENQNQNKANLTALNSEIEKQKLRDLYIYIAALLVIIIAILGGYALYRKCVEKKALEAIEREYQIMLMNLLNSASSQISSSQEDNRPYSCSQINRNNLENIENEGNQNFYNSLDHNHEERMENIRKKFGNSLVIKCLLKKQIEEILYTKNIGEEFGDNCTICMDNFVENAIISKTPCEHIFHKKCFETYLKEIQKKDKLLCPNCNQNLLVNKKFLKLRAKTRKVEIIKNAKGKKEIKESEINLQNEMKNRNSVMTNKNEDIVANNNENEIIFIKKKYRKGKNKINDNKSINIFNIKEKTEGNIYNPLQIKIKRNESESKNDIDTILPYNNDEKQNKKEEKKEEEGKIKIIKRNIVILNNSYKKNISLNNSLNSNESKKRLNNKKIKLKINDASSECDRIAVGKKSFSPNIPSTAKEN